MERYKEYIGHDHSEVPLSNIAQRIMSAMQSVPSKEAQNSRKHEQIEKITCPQPNFYTFEQCIPVFQGQQQGVSILPSSSMSTFINYQDVDIPKWDYIEENSSVKRKKNKDSEKSKIVSLKRKQDISYCSYKLEQWLPVKEAVNPTKTKYDWASEQAELPEKTFWDIRNLGFEEKTQLITNIKEAVALVVTMLFQDGSSQLSSDQVNPLCPSNGSSVTNPIIWGACTRNDTVVYLKIEQSSVWEQQERAHKEYTREILLQIIHSTVICFNAKDFLRTLLHVYGDDISWKQVANCVVLDPRIAAWLINPSDTVPSFEYLIHKYFEKPVSERTMNMNTDSLRNTLILCFALQVQGLWKLFCTLELPLIKILLRLKELEQEAHQAAGWQFLLTSNSQLREVLFRLLYFFKLLTLQILSMERGYRAVMLNKLQDLHPLPKIILEYRQGFISSTWNQTGTVTGRLSAKHPNIQGISKHPVQIIKKQYVKGKENEIVTISPRTLFVSVKGYTFLAADFSHIELRILAHLSCDPELLKLFQESETTDVFTTLASQWKGIPRKQVKHADREQAKRVVYSVVYGAGKERLAGCLGITPLQAGKFIESFLVKYKKIHDFTKKTIDQCHNQGYVLSIMGRKRPLPNINARDYRLRAQAERQAVNFVVQGSAADLCKMAMVEIFTSVAISPTLTARLVMQTWKKEIILLSHNAVVCDQIELLEFEVEFPIKAENRGFQNVNISIGIFLCDTGIFVKSLSCGSRTPNHSMGLLTKSNNTIGFGPINILYNNIILSL
uniref:DNA polymerase nu n=1 Tax=Pelusios castaneus TaxID=367368 RepID=A0A8C8RIZ3_9SAUR